MEREHKKSIIPVHVEVVITYLPLSLGEEENFLSITSGWESVC